MIENTGYDMYKAVFEHSLQALFITGRRAKVIEVNNTALELFGYTRQEFMMLSGKALLEESAASCANKHNDNNLITRTKALAVGVKKNGDRFRCEISAAYFTDSSGAKCTSYQIADLSQCDQQQKRTDEILLEANAAGRYKNVLDSISDGYITIDKDWNFSYLNEKGAAILHGTPEEFVGRNVWKSFPDAVNFGFYQSFQSVMRDRVPATLEDYYAPLNLHFESRAYPSADGGITVLFTDITRRRASDLELQTSQKEMKLILDNTEEKFMIVDRDLKLVACNAAYRVLLRKVIGRDLKKGESVLNATHPSHLEELMRIYEQVILGKKVKGQFSLPDTNGELILNATFTPFFNTRGEVDMFMISTLNITEEEVTKRALRESEEKYRHIFYSNPMPLLICDIVSGKLLDVNEAALHQYGYTREEFLQMELKDLWPPEDRELLHTVIHSHNDRSLLYKGQSRHQKKDGGWMHVDITSYRIRYEGKQVALLLSNDITDQRNARIKLERNELRFRSLIEKGSEIIALHDANGVIIYISPSVKQILGYDAYERVGKSAFEWVHNGDVPAIKKTLENLMRNPGATAQAQWRHKHADGSWRWMAGVATNLLHDPAVNAVVHNFRDITAQKEAENKTLLEKELSESIINSLPGIFYLYNKKGKFIRWNRNFEKMSGYTGEEIRQMHPLDFFAEADKPLFAEGIRKVFETGNAEVETTFYTKDARRLYYYFNGWACEFENEQCLIGMGIDITERREAQEAIRVSEEKTRLIMNAALDAIICMDTSGCISFWNPQAEKIFGWKGEEVMGKSLATVIIPEAYRDMHNSGLDKYLQTGQGNNLNRLLEMHAINREGKEFPIELTVLPIQQGGEQFFCSFIRDITVRKSSERAIKISNERYTMVTHATNDSIWDWDFASNQVIRDGKCLETEFGYEAWDAAEVDANWKKAAHAEDWARVTERRNAMLADPSQNFWEDEYRFRTKNGEYGYVFDRGYIIRDTNGKAVRMIGASQDITHRKKQEEALKEKNSELIRLSTYLQGVREDERKFIAREVHDELGQLASALKIDIDWLNLRIPGLEDNARKRIDHANKTIQILISSIRQIASSLRPSVLDDFGLNAALKWHCTEFQNLNGIPCIFDAGFDDTDLPKPVQTEFFRITQESLTNVMRHAQATNVTVTTREDGSQRYLVITDNGTGFDDSLRKNTLGLIGLRERAASLNGKLTIDSKPGKGTSISVAIPR